MEKRIPLADLCDLIVDCKNRTPPAVGEGETPVGHAIGTPHINNGRIDLSNANQVSKETFDTWTTRAVPQPGDIILTREAPVGRVGCVELGMKICLGQRTMLIRPNPQISNPRYLSYLLLGPQVQTELNSRASGSTVPHLRVDQVRHLPVPEVPTLSTQRAIAEVLGALDDKIAVNERIAKTSISLGDGLHEILMSGGGSGSARVMSIAELASGGLLSFGDGYRTKRSEHGTPGLPILRVAEVGDGDITPAFADYVREEFRPAMGAKVSKSGDVVLTTKGTVGRVSLISAAQPEFVYSPQVCYFRTSSGSPISNFYLFHWFRGQEFWRQANGLKGQTDMADYLSLRDVRSLRVTVPPHEQASEFDEKCTAIYARVESARSENRTLRELRDTLLPQLVTGKLRIKDAERAVEDAV